MHSKVGDGVPRMFGMRIKLKEVRKIVISAIIVWIVLLTVATVISPYFRIMHDNSTIVELGIGEGLLYVTHDVVYDDDIGSLANTTILGLSSHGPPKRSKLFSDWKTYLGVDCAVLWDSRRSRQWLDGVALWLVALMGTILFAAIRFFVR